MVDMFHTHALLSPVTLCTTPFVAAKLFIFYTSWLMWPHKVPYKSAVELSTEQAILNLLQVATLTPL